MLHTVNKSPFDSHSLQTCLGLAKAGSDILLIEDAVYAAMSGTAVTSMVESAMSSSPFTRWSRISGHAELDPRR